MSQSHKYKTLIRIATKLMRKSGDTLHDLAHVRRVVGYTKKLTQEIHNTEHRQAIILAAWWHDAGRVVTPMASMVIMSFLDDILSACMLWHYAHKHRCFSKVVWIAGRILIGNSLGTGKLFSKFILTKSERHLAHILKDADDLDALDVERIKQIIPFVNDSAIYYYSYKTLAHWWVSYSRLVMRTHEARACIEEIIRALIAWLSKADIRHWHVQTFGYEWSKKMFDRLANVLDEITLLNLKHTA